MTNSLLMELIHTCCSSGISTAIAVSFGQEEGRLYIRDGEIIHAETGGEEGEEALRRMLSREYGQVETLGFPAAVRASMARPWREILESLAPEPAGSPESPGRLKVLVVDDSAMMRRAISDIVAAQPDMEVAATAANGEDALARMAEGRFDVITLDVNMPVMDGSTAIKHIMIKKPCPVVIISNTDRAAVGNIMDFLMLGAVDFVAKPVRGGNLALQADRIAGRIRTAAKAGSSSITRFKPPAKRQEREAGQGEEKRPAARLVVVVAGAGGHADWFKLVCGLPENLDACVLVIQNMPPDFVAPLAEYTAARSMMDVAPLYGEAAVLSGTCYIAAVDAPPAIMMRRGLPILVEGGPIAAPDSADGLEALLAGLSGAMKEPVRVLLLSGADGSRAAEGLRLVKERGGRVVICAREAAMVRAPLDEIAGQGLVTEEKKVEAMIEEIVQYASGQAENPPSAEDDVPGLDWLI